VKNDDPNIPVKVIIFILCLISFGYLPGSRTGDLHGNDFLT
jgi:hypothetical protein